MMKNVAKDLKLSQRAESTANQGVRVPFLVLENELANTEMR